MEENLYACGVCDTSFKSLRNHAYHQKIHAINNSFSCGKPGCFSDFPSFADLNSHISKVHVNLKERTSDREENMVNCSVCQSLKSIADLCHHVQDHIKRGAKDVMCPFLVLAVGDGCKRKDPLTSPSIYSKHLSQHHSGWKELPLPPPCPVANIPETTEGAQPPQEFNDDEEEIFYDADDTFYFEDNDVFSFIGMFYLMLETECFLPVSTIDKISESLTTLSEMVQSNMNRKMLPQLQSLALSEVKIESLMCELANSNLLYVSHHKELRGPCFTSDHLRLKFFTSNFGLVLPKSVPQSDDTLEPNTYQFVPPRDLIENLLKDPTVQKEVEDSFERFAHSNANAASGIYRDYHDGSVMRSRNLPVKRIDVIMFQDGFAPTTMLTTVRQRHNTLGVYISLGNIRTWRRTKLKAMQMVMLVLEKDVKVYRQECFKKLVEHFQELERNGVDFRGEKIPVFLQFCVGDSKGAHFIGGFVECFSGIYFCRFCPITRADFHEDPLLLQEYRTDVNYKNSAKLVQAGNINNHQGVKEICLLNKLQYFSVCDPSLPPCLGHDMFLGAVDADMRALIGQFVKDELFTIKFLNQRIESFNYSPSDSKNKPAPVREEGKKLGGSAVQNWLLIRLFVFIIGDKIEVDNIYWQLYLILKQLCEYVCAPIITDQQIDELEAILVKYLTRRQNLPVKFKPKHHFMRHYPDLIRKFGPLIHVWGMRFEQRHQIFKRIAKACNNFINLLFTMATRHQLHFMFESQGKRFSALIKYKPVQLNPGIFPAEVFDFLSTQTDLTNALTSKVMKINGQEYRERQWLILNSTDSHIKVGLIKCMVILDNSKVMFVLKESKAFHNNDYGLYEICETISELSYVAFEDLLYPCPISVYDFLDKWWVSLKNTIPPS